MRCGRWVACRASTAPTALSAAYRNLDAEAAQDVTRRCEDFCTHYGLLASRCNPGEAHENGSVESHNRHLKTALDQALLLRGGRDFDDVADWRRFVDQLVARRNRRREDAVRVEMAALRPLPARRTTDFTEAVVRVTRTGGFLVHSVFYSAPSRTIGQRLQVHIYDDRIEAFLGATRVVSHPRRRGRPNGVRVHQVDYHHVIHALRRKPHALAGSVYRDGLFPRTEYAAAWSALSVALPRRDACRRMVGLLWLAHEEACEAELAALIADNLATGHLPDANDLKPRLEPRRRSLPDRRAGHTHRPRQLRRSVGDAHMTAPTRIVDVHALPTMLTALRLPSFHRHWPMLAERADKEGWPAARFLATLAEIELAERETRRIRRHLIESQLPGGKTLATFDFKALPSVPRARVEALAAGDWIETGANLIAIGNSGADKTHLLCAVGHALVEAGRRVLYTRTTDLVQKLQAARRDLALETALAKLDRFELIILDDIGYARKDQAETSVLFELIARRFETRSLAIAANQPFSAWDTVFPDQAVTVAAIDRLVHHATILEMNADSYRRRAAADRTALKADAAATPSAESLGDQPADTLKENFKT